MSDPTIAEARAELAWRLTRAIADPAERAANDARIAVLSRAVAEAYAPPPPPVSPPDDTGMGAMLALALIFAAFAMFLAF